MFMKKYVAISHAYVEASGH